MDAEDIFRKLSRGAKFSSKKVIKPAASKVELKPLEIKSEVIDEVEDTDNDPITLLGDITTTNKKGKKRKADSDDTDVERKKLLLAQEKVNQYRNENNIHVVGRHIADPIESFDALNVKSDIIENLKISGYKEPTAIQKQAIPVMLEKRQVLACAPTGSGKTAAFLVPLVHFLKEPQKQGTRALVICPTRELAQQTQRECMRLAEGRDLKIHVITKINQALKKSFKHDILITTPNRLCFLLNHEPPMISLGSVEWVIIDEADKLFEEGTRSFKDQLTQILSACTSSSRTIGMFSATYTPAVAKWCVRNMRGLIRISVGQRNTTTDLVEQQLVFVGNESGKLLAFRDLVRKGLTPPVLVFVQSKERAQQLFSELIYDGINVDAIHADRTQLQRDNTVRSFREGKIWVLICTELMARGIDFKGVNLVINYDFPPSAIAYVHRVGRAGRAGREGKAITFFTLEDTVNLRSIAHILKRSGCEVPDYMLYMKKRSKREKKRLERSAPEREDILTMPYDERRRIDSAKGLNRLKVKKKVKEVKPARRIKDKEGKKNGLVQREKDNKKKSALKRPMKVKEGKKKGLKSGKNVSVKKKKVK